MGFRYNLRYILSTLILFFSCTPFPEDIPGCTNSNACNFNPEANEDDGSCSNKIDCLGLCGGSAYIDLCGYCDANTENDCLGECSEILSQLSFDDVIYECDQTETVNGYFCNDLKVIQNIINNNPGSIHIGMDANENKIISVLEYGDQGWLNGRLVSLDLNYNENVVTPTFCNFRLTTLPENIGDLSALTKLSLINNELTLLPESITNLVSLEQLLLESNQLTSLPDDFGNLINLKELNLNSNQIEQLPETIGSLISLEKLWANNNQLVYLPESIGNLIQLEWLYLNNNLLQSIPESIANLESLIIFNIDNNNLFALPESLCTETDGISFYDGMQSFSINNNYICSDTDTTIIAEYAYPLCLEAILENGGNQICEGCPPHFFFIEGYCAWESDYNILQNFLDLNPGSIEEGLIPMHAYGATNPHWWDAGRLVEITLQHKQLTSEIPESLGLLDKLERLRLTGNILSGSIPNSLTNLENLQILKLSSNNLSGVIPENIGALTRLDSIILSDNLFSGSIPSSIGSMTNIKYLYFDGNLLTGSIPESIGDLGKIVNLYLDNNKLTGEIPSSIGNLLTLKRLYLLNNFLTGEIPEQICNIYSYNPDFRSVFHNNELCPPYPECIPLNHLGQYNVIQQDTTNCNE